MENEASKTESAKANTKPVITSLRGKTLDNSKEALLLYKISLQNAREIVDLFCDALNQANTPDHGCVYVKPEHIVDLSAKEMQDVKKQRDEWMERTPNHVVLLCLGGDGLSREGFLGENGKLHCKIFPVCFGNLRPSDWPEAYCLGVKDPDNLNQANDLEGEGLDTLVAAIRGTDLN